MVNLTPQDAPNPLYVNRYAELRAVLLLDHMLQDAIDTNDPRMGSPNGLRAETFTGKTVVFRRDSLGKNVLQDTGSRVTDVTCEIITQILF